MGSHPAPVMFVRKNHAPVSCPVPSSSARAYSAPQIVWKRRLWLCALEMRIYFIAQVNAVLNVFCRFVQHPSLQ
eukprot:2677525-Rhodomonas_salina.5